MNKSHTPDISTDIAERTATAADDALAATRRTAKEGSRKIDDGVDSMRQSVPQALSRATEHAEYLTRRGIERARQASSAVRDSAVRMSDQTVGYIKDEPVKSVLIAAGVGALTALLVGWLGRSSRHSHAGQVR